jgi:putative salt-induced outer membrane protein YdiY
MKKIFLLSILLVPTLCAAESENEDSSTITTENSSTEAQTSDNSATEKNKLMFIKVPISSNEPVILVTGDDQSKQIPAGEEKIKTAEQARALAEKYQKLADSFKKLADQKQKEKEEKIKQIALEKAKAQKAEEAQTEDIDEAVDLAGDPVVKQFIKEESGSPFDGSNFSFGGSNTTGNTETTNITLGGLLNFIPKGYNGQWENNVATNYQYQTGGDRGSSKVGQTQVNRFYLSQTSNYFFTPKKRNGFTWNINYLNDKFDGFYYIVNESAGYLRRILETDTMTLDASLAPGLQQFRERKSDDFQNLPSLTLKINYAWNLTDDTVFTQKFASTTSSNTTLSTSNSTIATKLWENFQLNTSFLASFSSKPQPNKVKTNTTTQVTIQYNF